MPSIADAAERYVRERRFAVYPADPQSKRALIAGWNEAAAARDPERARFFFERDYPKAAIGIACSPSKIIVIDVDPRNGGDASWRKLCDEVGLEAFESCPIVATPSGGQHAYFRQDDAAPIRSGAHVLGPGIDVIGIGGGVIAPPSNRGSSLYRWRTESGECDGEPPLIPKALSERINAIRRRRLSVVLPANILPGARNSWLTRFAGKLRRAGCSESEIIAALQEANVQRCQPPLEERDVETIAKSIAKYAPERDGVGWLTAWRRIPMTPQELRVVLFFGTLAEHIAGPLSPASEYAARETNMAANHFLAARKRLQDRGAIVVHNRGRRLAPIVELRFPPPTVQV